MLNQNAYAISPQIALKYQKYFNSFIIACARFAVSNNKDISEIDDTLQHSIKNIFMLPRKEYLPSNNILNTVLQPAINRKTYQATLMNKSRSGEKRISFVDAKVCWLFVMWKRKQLLVDSSVVRHVSVLQFWIWKEPSNHTSSEKRYLFVLYDDENIDIFIATLDVEHVSVNQS